MRTRVATRPAVVPSDALPAEPIEQRRVSLPVWLVPVLTVWAGTRIAIAMCAWLASWLVSRHWIRHHEPLLRRGLHPTDILGGWDGRWYEHIAVHGYPFHVVAGHQGAVAFFPLLPLAIAGLVSLGLPALGAGLVAGNLAGLGALIAVAALTRRLFDDGLAVRTALYLAISPLGFVLAMPYSEPLAIALAFGAAALAFDERAASAGVLALLAGLTRPTGVAIALPLAVLALRRVRRKPALLAVALAPLAGLAAFCGYLWLHTGDPLAFLHVQASWGRHSPSAGGIDVAVAHSASQLWAPRSIWGLRDTAIGLGTLALLAYAALRRVPAEWIAFGALCVLVPLTSASTQSLARFSLLALPAFWGLALLGRHRAFDQAYRLVAPALLGVGVLTLPLHWP